ncbi:MAG: FapA family protein [Treponema sp.]|jgi:hypothetical protein|nr:FapA family protein [Treponema sp.]
MAAVTIRGDVSITVSPDETEAKLVFVPGRAAARSWDTVAINRLIKDAGISGVNQEKLESFLFKTAYSRAAAEFTLAEGIKPEEPSPERAVWDRIDFPPDIRPLVKEVLSKAGPPSLSRAKTERFKTEKVVQKPGGLPFLSPKEEKVVSWDKRMVPEPVQVDPAVLKVGFAERGLRVGALKPPTAGRPGKTIFGKRIMPAALEVREFLLGYGLVRGNDEIRSTVSGILRIGGNWADVVPLAKSSWEITIGQDGVTLYLRFSPGNAAFPPPPAREILTAASASGDPDSPVLIGSGELEEAMRESLRTGEPLEAFPLYKTLDGLAEVRRNGEGHFLYLRKGLAGGRPLDAATVSLALRKSGIRGVDPEALRGAVVAFMQDSEGELWYPLRGPGA